MTLDVCLICKRPFDQWHPAVPVVRSGESEWLRVHSGECSKEAQRRFGTLVRWLMSDGAVEFLGGR